MEKYFATGDRVLLFTDSHWGHDKNSDQFLETTTTVMKWIAKEAVQRGISTIVFMGDWFDHRDIISVKTSNTAYDALKELVSNDLQIFLILGNHDIYYKEKVEVNSIRSYSDIPNVTVVQQVSELNINKKKLLLVPWLGKFDDVQKEIAYDAILGHIETKGIQYNILGGKRSISEHGTLPTTLFEFSPLVYMGHYHIRNKYDFKTGEIRVMGNPNQMDVGDSNLDKGIVQLNLNDMSEVFIENTFSPKYVDLFYSSYCTDLKKIPEKDVRGNYPRLIIDVQHDWDILNRMIAKMNSMEPKKPVVPKYLHSVTFQGQLEEAKKHLTESVDSVPIGDFFTDPTASLENSMVAYVDMVIKRMEAGSVLDDSKLKKMIGNYVKKASGKDGE